MSLPVWLQHGLTNLRKLRLGGCESLDFGALSTFLNGSTVNDLDLSNNYLILTSPAEISVFIGKAKTIKRLRSEHSPCLQKSPDSKNSFHQSINRILGQPVFVIEGEYSREITKSVNKALNDANMTRNSQFALAIIQTLLANNGASAFQVIESVNCHSLSLLFIDLRESTTSKK